jgi:hypothetical protein
MARAPFNTRVIIYASYWDWAGNVPSNDDDGRFVPRDQIEEITGLGPLVLGYVTTEWPNSIAGGFYLSGTDLVCQTEWANFVDLPDLGMSGLAVASVDAVNTGTEPPYYRLWVYTPFWF